MSVSGIGNSAASWAQFVKLTQAARDRNSGLGTDTAPSVKKAATTQNVNNVPFKRAADVYLSSAQNVQTPVTVRNEPLNRKIAGGLFDAYA